MGDSGGGFDSPAGTNADRGEQRRCRYGKGLEARAIKQEIGNFEIHTSHGYFLITRLFTEKILVTDLRNVVEAARTLLHYRRQIDLPPLSRNAKRSKALLVKYVDTHLNELAPVLSQMVLQDADHQPLYPPVSLPPVL
jgi:hypothetical protein